MISFEVRTLAANRAIISIMSHLDKVENNTLTLKKGDIANAWSSSKSSKRDICLAAVSLGDSLIRQTNPTDNSFSIEALFTGITASTYSIEFEFTNEGLSRLKQAATAFFSGYQLEDFVSMRSRFTLNFVLAHLFVADTSNVSELNYSTLRLINECDESYEHKQAFYRHVVQVAFADLSKLENHPLTHIATEQVNPETKRKITTGIKTFPL